MKPLSFLFLAFFLIVAPAVHALDLRTELTQRKNFLGVSGEMSRFKLDEGSLSGSGVKLDFTHAFTDRANIEMYLSSAVNATGGVQTSFTGLGGYAMYNIFGNCCQEERVIYVDGKPLLTESMEKGSSLQVGLGLDQFFLNGSKAVYSASGLGFAIGYQFKVYRYNFKAGLRQSQMASGQSKIAGQFYSIGMVFSL